MKGDTTALTVVLMKRATLCCPFHLVEERESHAELKLFHC